MPSWRTLDADRMPIVTSLATAASLVQGPLNGIIAATDAVAATLLIVENLMAAVGSDPTSAIRGAIDVVITDIVESRVSVLIVKPKLNVVVRGYDGFGRLLEDTLVDAADVHRPQFDFGDTVTGFIAMASAPSFLELAPVAELFQTIFLGGWEEIVDAARALPGAIYPQRTVNTAGIVTGVLDDEDPRSTFVDRGAIRRGIVDPFSGRRLRMITGRNANITTTIRSFDSTTGVFRVEPFPGDVRQGDAYVTMYGRAGLAPDWRSVRLLEVFPPIGHLVSALAQLRDAIGPQRRTAAILGMILDMLQRKAAFLQEAMARVQSAVDQLENLEKLTNISFLPIPPTELGNYGISRAYYDAAAKPVVSPNAAVIAVAVVGGSGLVAPLTTIFGPLFTD